ncbi:MAG: TetR/AcrR family transcriptional regulator [Chloroflexota bacterium]
MPRTLNPEAHAVRRDAFLDAAQRLIQSKGYEQMSVQDVLDELETSKGAFYHYFDSKGALLDAVVERMVATSIAALEPIAFDATVPAIDRIRAMFASIASLKADQKDFLLELLRVWMSDDNAVVRERFRRSVTERMTPLMARTVREGTAAGTFTATSPADAAHVVVSLILGANAAATELYMANELGAVGFEEARRMLTAYAEAFERILGAPPGSLPLVDDAVLHEWYG